MLNNRVDAGKRKGAGTKQNIIVATSPETNEKGKVRSWGGKYQAPTLDFGRDGNQFVLCKYEKNTQKDVEKRMAKTRKQSEGLSH